MTPMKDVKEIKRRVELIVSAAIPGRRAIGRPGLPIVREVVVPVKQIVSGQLRRIGAAELKDAG